MFDQLHDLSYDLVRERLLDARRDLAAAKDVQPISARITALRIHVYNRLGDLLIAWGVHLKHQDPCQDFAKGWAWQDRR